jgi:predicted RNase H-like nuclease (RuvC/YqgF family)
VAEVYPDLVVSDRQGKPETVRYHLINALLLNEVQKQHRTAEAQEKRMEQQKETIEQQKETIDHEQAEIERLKARMSRLEARLLTELRP